MSGWLAAVDEALDIYRRRCACGCGRLIFRKHGESLRDYRVRQYFCRHCYLVSAPRNSVRRGYFMKR